MVIAGMKMQIYWERRNAINKLKGQKQLNN